MREPLLPPRQSRRGDFSTARDKSVVPPVMKPASAGDNTRDGRLPPDSFIYHNVMKMQREGAVTTI